MTAILEIPEALQPVAGRQDEATTLLVYGALLSPKSARLTFLQLRNFRLVRLRGYRRVFGHPHLFLWQQNVLNMQDPHRRWASLSVEPTNNASLVAAAFDVDLDDTQRRAFVERERGYQMARVPFYALDATDSATDSASTALEDPASLPIGHGVICLAGSTTVNKQHDDVAQQFRDATGHSVWNWDRDSQLLPADVYLRHVWLAVQQAGPVAQASFLQDTTLGDRTTTHGQYLSREETMERVMKARPPPHLKERFSG